MNIEIKSIQDKKLKKDFVLENKLTKKKFSGLEIDEKFYNFYFGEIAKQNNLNIKLFYNFGNYKKNKQNDLIPKSITKPYLKRLKMNKEFISKLKNYIKNNLLTDFCNFNSKKIKKMILNWETLLEKEGKEHGINIIVKKISSKTNKLPWTFSEVAYSIKVSLDFLEKC